MSKWRRDPELDENAKVGLSFIGIGYGVVLVAVFPLTTSLSSISVAGYFHLAMAAFLLVTSYMGYYSNRQRYAAWQVKFFNIPLLQYIISFGILFLYWELGITVPKRSEEVTPISEAVIVLIVFLGYLAWDCLEVTVQESCKYLKELIRTGNFEMLPPLAKSYTKRTKPHQISTKSRRFAKNVRASRTVTLAYSCLYFICLVIAIGYHVQGGPWVIAFDSFYIVTFFAYRYSQWKWSHYWYRPSDAQRADMNRAQHKARAGTRSPAEELTKLADSLEQGLLTHDEFDLMKADLLGRPSALPGS